MKMLMITAVLVMSIGCSKAKPKPLMGDELGSYLKQQKYVQRFYPWYHGFMPGMTCGILLGSAACYATIFFISKQPYNGIIGRLEGWETLAESQRVETLTLQDSFALEGENDENVEND
jgi:hypothetical protein